MSLAVATNVALADTNETTLVSYTAVAGDFIRGFFAKGPAEAELFLKVNAVIKDFDVIPFDSASDNGPERMGGHIVAPIALSSGDAVLLTAQRSEADQSRNFDGVIE